MLEDATPVIEFEVTKDQLPLRANLDFDLLVRIAHRHLEATQPDGMDRRPKMGSYSCQGPYIASGWLASQFHSNAASI